MGQIYSVNSVRIVPLKKLECSKERNLQCFPVTWLLIK